MLEKKGQKILIRVVHIHQTKWPRVAKDVSIIVAASVSEWGCTERPEMSPEFTEPGSADF